jgi:endoglucanase
MEFLMKNLKKPCKLLVLAAMALVASGLILSGCTSAPAEEVPHEPPPTPIPSSSPPATESPDPDPGDDTTNQNASDISHLTSMEITHMMTAGWNLGNTLDSHWNARAWGTIAVSSDQETLWGNPVTTKAMIDFVKASGFDTVRIPVTWYIFTGDGPEYLIDDAWMDRVQEVVDYVIDNDMFAILNIHHDDYLRGYDWECGWLRLYGDDEPLSDEEKAEKHLRFSRLWAQIAERFKDYDEYLIFEGINEPRTIGLGRYTREIWEEQSIFLNELLQTFVDTVRACSGINPDRHLLVTPYFASVGMDPNDGEGRIMHFIDSENGKMWVNDPRDRLIASLHYYEPWGFVTAPADSQWFSWHFDLEVGSVSHNLNVLQRIIEENFTAHGIPVIMGETGALHRTMPDDSSNEAERVKWAEYFVSMLRDLGIPVIIWDDGGQFRLLDRLALEWAWPDLASMLVSAAGGGS